eukprot:scaffold2143_cov125-Cylindrotheca_fusiformis.AAC.10
MDSRYLQEEGDNDIRHDIWMEQSCRVTTTFGSEDDVDNEHNVGSWNQPLAVLETEVSLFLQRHKQKPLTHRTTDVAREQGALERLPSLSFRQRVKETSLDTLVNIVASSNMFTTNPCGRNVGAIRLCEQNHSVRTGSAQGCQTWRCSGDAGCGFVGVGSHWTFGRTNGSTGAVTN